jgi:hypothetical protein
LVVGADFKSRGEVIQEFHRRLDGAISVAGGDVKQHASVLAHAARDKVILP